MKSHPRLADYLLAAGLMLLAACSGGGSNSGNPPLPPPVAPVFLPEGLDGHIIRHIYQHDNRLFAATDNGLFSKLIAQDDWLPVGLSGFSVQDLAIISDQHWLAAVFPTANPFVDPKLFETVNAGSNWLDVANDFGPGPTQTEGIFALHYDQANQQLFATGTNALASSDDFGRH